MMSRYHKAAIDGYLELLKEATRKDLNTPDEDGMTPTLWAAFHGHIEALQLICSRGGDPTRSDIWGNTPLHHAATNGHMHIISFLVSFGANLFALDNDFHTAMDVAASRDRMDCVRYLDVAAAQQTAQNAKRVAGLKKEANKEAEKRVKVCEKVQRRHQSKMDKMYSGAAEGEFASDGGATASLRGTHTARGVNEQFSKIIAADTSGSLTARVKGTLQKRFGKKDKDTLPKSGGDGNVLFLRQEGGAGGKPEFVGVFSEQDEAGFGEDGTTGLADEGGDEPGQIKQSIFNRPGLGGLTFMKKLGSDADDFLGGSDENLGYFVQSEMPVGGDAGFEGSGDADVPWNQEELGLDDDVDEETSSLDVFLAAISLQEFSLAFDREQLDLEALMLCSDEDLKGIRIQLGPRKKILEAAARRKNTLREAAVMKDSCM